jgi:hypothetical protein
MSRSGPKPRTAKNTSGRHPGLIRRSSEEPTSELSLEALREFQRLLEVLRSMGTLDRVDLGVVTEAARVKDLLDQFYRIPGLPNRATIAAIGLLTSQVRGLRRELGLTTMPSRSLVRVDPGPFEGGDDPVATRIRLA